MINKNENLIVDYQLIESYFSFELNQEQLNEFEHRLKKDATFRDRVTHFERIDSSIRQFAFKKKEKEIKTAWKECLHENVDVLEKPSLMLRLQSVIKIAAAILFLILGGYWFWNTYQSSNSMTILAESYWQESPKSAFPHLILKSNDTAQEKDSIIKKAYRAFKAQEYSRTIDLLENKYSRTIYLLENICEDSFNYLELKGLQRYAEFIDSLENASKDSSSYIILLLQGESYLGLHQAAQAIGLFQELIEHPSGIGRDEALWFQALAYLQIEQPEPAIANLKLIVNNNYPQAKKAKELLMKLEKIKH